MFVVDNGYVRGRQWVCVCWTIGMFGVGWMFGRQRVCMWKAMWMFVVDNGYACGRQWVCLV